jgi:hypothetical protein
MCVFGKVAIVFVLAGFLALGPLAPALTAAEHLEAEKPSGGMMMWDTLAMRPLGICATVIGTAFWIVSYPFAYLGGNVEESTEALVQTPFDWTFHRPLGEF